ncbi:hypothetical protein BH24ACT3_BH24ACT3_04530 [soil metagenome]
MALVIALLVASAGPGGARPNQSDDTLPTPTIVEPAPAPTTTTSTTAPELERASSESAPSDGSELWLIVAGLVVVAVLLTVFTVIYWRRTRPVARQRAWETSAEPTGAHQVAEGSTAPSAAPPDRAPPATGRAERPLHATRRVP